MTTLGAQPQRHPLARAATVALLVVTALLMPSAAAQAASDWPAWRHDSARTGFNPEERELRPPLQLLWTRNDVRELELTASGGLVFAAGADQRLWALAAADGQVVWSDSGDRFPFRAGALAAVGRVFATSLFGLWALDRAAGDLTWTREDVSGWDELAFAGAVLTDGRAGYDPRTGETVWDLPYRCADGVMGTYAVSGTTIYTAGWDGFAGRNVMRACGTGGEVVWEAEGPLGVGSGLPAVAAGRLFVAWDTTSGPFLTSVDAVTGANLMDVPVGRSVTSPAVAYGRVYVGDAEGLVRAFDASTLEPLWKTGVVGAVTSSPAVANEVVYVTTTVRSENKVRLYALAASDGSALWTYELPGTVFTSPIVADGRLYVLDREGCQRCTLYAFGSEEPAAEPEPVAPVSEPEPVEPVPELGRSVLVAPVSGTVLVRLPGEAKFVPLDAPRGVPLGSEVDAREGRVELTSVRDASGTLQTGIFFDGLFRVLQPAEADPTTELRLEGGDFSRCTDATPETSIRHLWGEAAGAFRTRGRYSSTTVRGTVWLIEDRCAGTRTFVREGSVEVEDLERGRVTVLEAGQDYLVAPAARSRLWLIVGLAGGGLLGISFLGTAGVLWRRRRVVVADASPRGFCTRCGAPLRPESRFCGACGAHALPRKSGPDRMSGQ